jgi:hypothetical protein
VDDFHVAYLEGLFCQAGPDDYNVVVDGSPHSVAKALAPMVGRQVHAVLQHFPPDLDNLNPAEWGGGCCDWQPNLCPAGHHERPNFLFNQDVKGVLRRHSASYGPLMEEVSWSVEGTGYPVFLEFDKMRRHHGRLAVLTEFDPEDVTLTDADVEKIAVVGGKLKELVRALERMGGKGS